MAFIIDAWAGEDLLGSMRCNRRTEFAAFVVHWSKKAACTKITKERSDGRGNVETLYPPNAGSPPRRGARPLFEVGCCPTCDTRLYMPTL